METITKVCLVASFLVIVQSAPRQKRLTLAEITPSYYYSNINGNPDVYSFGYDISDSATGNNQYRKEERHPNGTVTGLYGYIDPSGTPRRFKYIADKNGYRVYSDYSTQAPISMPFMESGTTESSITWTRPPKKANKKKITIRNDFVSQLGLLFGH